MRVATRSEILLERELITGLGRGLAARGTLDDAAIARTVDALAACAAEARALGASVRAVGTSALRDAKDRERFLAEAKARAGVDVEVISGAREAALTFRGAIDGLPIPDGDRVTVIDIGGGSTEIAQGHAGRAPEQWTSIDLGSVRLAPLVTTGPVSDAELAVLEKTIAEGLKAGLPPLDPRAACVAVSGTALTMAAIVLGVRHEELAKVHGVRLPWVQILQTCGELTKRSRAELEAHPAIAPGRADLVIPGSALLVQAIAKAKASSCLISGGGVRVGVLLEALDEGPISD